MEIPLIVTSNKFKSEFQGKSIKDKEMFTCMTLRGGTVVEAATVTPSDYFVSDVNCLSLLIYGFIYRRICSAGLRLENYSNLKGNNSHITNDITASSEHLDNPISHCSTICKTFSSVPSFPSFENSFTSLFLERIFFSSLVSQVDLDSLAEYFLLGMTSWETS